MKYNNVIPNFIQLAYYRFCIISILELLKRGGNRYIYDSISLDHWFMTSVYDV